MASNPLKNVSLADCRKFLLHAGCKKYRTTGGHEHWTRKDLRRPIPFKLKLTLVPERIMKQIITALGIGRDEFRDILRKI